MPWSSELAQLPTPTIASLILAKLPPRRSGASGGAELHRSSGRAPQELRPSRPAGDDGGRGSITCLPPRGHDTLVVSWGRGPMRRPTGEIALLLLAIAALFAMLLGNLGHPLFWSDEADTAMFGMRVREY